MAHSKSSTKNDGTREYIVDLNDNDVLLGRGQPILNYSGNVRFRKLIQERKEQYTSTGKHAVKDQIAREILDAIEGRGGRFVRKVDEAERDDLLVPDQVLHAWRIVDEQTRLSKVKQALREQVGKEGASAAGAAGPKNNTKSSRKRSSSEESPSPSMLEATRRQETFLSDANLLSSTNKRARSAGTIPSGLTGQGSLPYFHMQPFPQYMLGAGSQALSGSAGFSQQNRVFLPPTHPLMGDANNNNNNPLSSGSDIPFHGLSFTERQDLQRRLLLQQRQQAMELQRRQAQDTAHQTILPPWSLETAVQQYLMTQQRLQHDHLLQQQQQQLRRSAPPESSNDDEDDDANGAEL